MHGFFPTCQVRVVRFYVSLLLVLFLLLVVLLVPPRSFAFSVPSRTSTVTICALCSLPDLSPTICYLRSLPDLRRDRLRSAFLPGPPTATISAQCSLPDLQPRPSALSVPVRSNVRRFARKRMSDRMPENMSADYARKRMSDRMSESTPERMSERLSEDMSE